MLARGLSRSGHQVRVSALRPGTLAPEFEAAGVQVVTWESTGRYMRSLPWLFREVRRFKPDVVHTWLFMANIWGRVAASLARAPVIIGSVRGVDSWKRRPHWIADHALSYITAAIVSNSLAGAEYSARKARIRRSRYTVIRNGISPDLPDRQVPSARTQKERFRILTVGRLSPGKRVSVLLDALDTLWPRHRCLLLTVVGTGQEHLALRDHATRLGIGEIVKFLGLQQDVQPYYGRADCFVLPSVREGSSNAILEAMASGLPVIASDIPGNQEIIEDGITGLLVPPDKVNALAEAIERLVLDRELGERLGRRAREQVRENYSEERYIAEHVALYRRLAQSRR